MSPPPPIERVLGPFREFFRSTVSGGVLLMVAAVVALLWANSPWADGYESAWQTPMTIGIGSFVLSMPVQLWINDGLMALFFLVVGVEIKRELPLAMTKIGILAASVIAGVGGYLLLRLWATRNG